MFFDTLLTLSLALCDRDKEEGLVGHRLPLRVGGQVGVVPKAATPTRRIPHNIKEVGVEEGEVGVRRLEAEEEEGELGVVGVEVAEAVVVVVEVGLVVEVEEGEGACMRVVGTGVHMVVMDMPRGINARCLLTHWISVSPPLMRIHHKYSPIVRNTKCSNTNNLLLHNFSEEQQTCFLYLIHVSKNSHSSHNLTSRLSFIF